MSMAIPTPASQLSQSSLPPQIWQMLLPLFGLVRTPVSPIDGLWSPGILSQAPDPMVSLTPALISRSLWEC